MTEAELLQTLARGEDSRHQFKRDETNTDSIAAELAAFANSGGGVLFLGVEDKGRVTGLDATNVRRLNQLLSNAASQNVRPPIHPTTENIQTAQGIVIAVTVPDASANPTSITKAASGSRTVPTNATSPRARKSNACSSAPV